MIDVTLVVVVGIDVVLGLLIEIPVEGELDGFKIGDVFSGFFSSLTVSLLLKNEW